MSKAKGALPGACGEPCGGAVPVARKSFRMRMGERRAVEGLEPHGQSAISRAAMPSLQLTGASGR
jgi:hypothetical protein